MSDDKVRVLILENDDGEAAWLASDHINRHDPSDPDEWTVELNASEWERFQAAAKIIYEITATAVGKSPRFEDGTWRRPCTNFYEWHRDSTLAGIAESIGVTTDQVRLPSDSCSRCLHPRDSHNGAHAAEGTTE